MNYEMLIEENKYKEVEEFCKGERTYVTFRQAGGKDSEVLFLLVHGIETGEMAFGGYALTSEQVLTTLIKQGIKDRGIKHVYTLSCYGGLQPTVYQDGICMSSLHECEDVIHVGIGTLMDDLYCLSVFTE